MRVRDPDHVLVVRDVTEQTVTEDRLAQPSLGSDDGPAPRRRKRLGQLLFSYLLARRWIIGATVGEPAERWPRQAKMLQISCHVSPRGAVGTGQAQHSPLIHRIV